MKPTNTLWVIIGILGIGGGMLWAWSDHNAGRCLGCSNYGGGSSYSNSRVAMP